MIGTVVDTLVSSLERCIDTNASDLDIERLRHLIGLADGIGVDTELLSDALSAVVEERILMHLVGSIRSDLNFEDRRKLAYKRVQSLIGGGSGSSSGHTGDDAMELAHSLAELQSSIAEARSRMSRRAGIGATDEVTVRDMMNAQGNRCAICGVALKENARKTSARFADGLEPLGIPTLEHIVPYYLVGNSSDYELVCSGCNNTKNDRLGVQEEGLVLCGNTLRIGIQTQLKHRTAFWSVYYCRRCQDPDCANTSSNSLLLVSSKDAQHDYSYGNSSVWCISHAPDDAWWLHA